jgi:hypothetical protein
MPRAGKVQVLPDKKNPAIMNRYLTKVMIYHQAHQMNRDGFSIAYISQFLGLNWRTVKRLLSIVDDRDYERILQESGDRSKLLQPYENFVKLKLEQFRDTSSVQMQDWLREHFKDFPGASPKTVFNFSHGGSKVLLV